MDATSEPSASADLDEDAGELTVMGLKPSDLEPQERRDERIVRLLPTWISLLKTSGPRAGKISFSESPRSALPALTVRRDRKGVGRYLKDSKVLILKEEADRPAALRALDQAGIEVLNPMGDTRPGDPLFHGDVRPIGAWGNVLGLHAELPMEFKGEQLLALFVLDTGELFSLSNELVPALTTRLNYMGIRVQVAHPPNPLGRLNKKLSWLTDEWETSIVQNEPRYRAPDPTPEAPLRVAEGLAAELPAEVVAAYEEQLRSAHFDPLPNPKQGRSWETTNGVLDAADILAYLKLAPRGVKLPEGWEACWDKAVTLSPPHAPTLCALYLHDLFPDWWDALPLTEFRNRGTWLVGHSMSTPAWFRGDLTLETDRRMQCAVALVVREVGDMKMLNGLRRASRTKVGCVGCGRGFERGMLQAGEIYLKNSASLCGRCTGISWPRDPRALPQVQRDGLLAAIRWYIRAAGGVVSPGMLSSIEFPDGLSDEARFLMARPLPGFVLGNWIEWLGEAGVLGEETWRPSFGQISVAADGHLCRSFLERVIDDFFTIHGIAHEPEPHYPYDATLNPNGMRADWALADGTLVEAAGLMMKAEYVEKIQRKRQLAHAHGLRLVIVDDTDLDTLATVFADHLP